MDRTCMILTFAIFALFIANLSFSELMYFSPWQLVAINLLGLASAMAFFLAYSQRNKKIKLGRAISPYIIIAIVLFFVLISFQLIAVAAIISLAGIYVISLISKRLKSYKFYAAAALIIILVSSLAYISVSGLRGTNWKGVDEVAFNYYASYLLIHGTNPYTTSMLPILSKYNITPTFLLNGSTESAYDYPALSFLPVLFLPLLIPLSKLHNFLAFIAILSFITTLIAFFVYKKSKFNKLTLIPLAVWLIVTYAFIGTIDQYIAVSLFLVIAYTERKNIVLSSIFLGLAASTIQLAWFALPFFYILRLREEGKGRTLKSILISLAVFLIINSYFLIIAPRNFIADMFGIFGASKLILYGPNIMQILLRSYGVALWYPAVISIIALATLMLLFYFYTSTLKPLIAIAPAFIFFLSWRNLPMYGIAFVPLMIVLCYGKDTSKIRDIIRRKSYIALAFAVLVAIFLILAVYAHQVYTKENTLSITYVAPTIQITSNGYNFNGITLNITDNGNSYENVSIFLVNRYPFKDGIFLSPTLKQIAPHSSQKYSINFQVQSVKGNTSVYIIAFSKDYITNKEVNINLTAQVS